MVFRQGLINFLSASQDLRQGLLIDWLSNDPPWAVTDEGNSISLGRMTAARGRNRASSQAKSSPARNELPSASYQSVSNFLGEFCRVGSEIFFGHKTVRGDNERHHTRRRVLRGIRYEGEADRRARIGDLTLRSGATLCRLSLDLA
jgi:hypothetical protein